MSQLSQLDLCKLITDNYNIPSILKISKNEMGWGEVYRIDTLETSFIVKFFKVTNRHFNVENEIKVCQFLIQQGFPVSDFVKNKTGDYISYNAENTIIFHLQYFIEGQIWGKFEAPKWLLISSIQYLAKINISLQNFDLPLRNPFLRINDKQYHLNEIDKLYHVLKKSKYPARLSEDLLLRKKYIFQSKSIQLKDYTLVNSHGDYSVSQIITQGKFVKGIIDFSETSKVPAVWEILRFYFNSAPECRTGVLDIENLSSILLTYHLQNQLNQKDFQDIFEIFFIYMCQAISVYYYYLDTEDDRFLKRSFIRMDKINYLFKYKESLQDYLMVGLSKNFLLE